MTGDQQGLDSRLRLAAADRTAADRTAGDRDMTRGAPSEPREATWNPIIGCSGVSPGCDHCDAMRTVAQLARTGGRAGARYAGLVQPGPGGQVWTGAMRVSDDLLTWPLFRRDPQRIFVGSLSDLFHEGLATAILDRVHAVIAVAHWHRFLVLTKRAARMRAYYCDPHTPGRIAVEIGRLAAALRADPCAAGGVSRGAPGRSGRAAAPQTARTRRRWAIGFGRVAPAPGAPAEAHVRPVGLDPWPLPNLWPGVSVEDHDRLGRIGHLAQTPAALRWACFEPLLGPVRPDAVPVGEAYFDALGGLRYARDDRGRAFALEGPGWPPLDWVAAGGEVGPGARAMRLDWVRGLRDLCAQAGVPFCFRQWGEWAPAPADGFGDRMVRVGRRAAGRLLDGRLWNERTAANAAMNGSPCRARRVSFGRSCPRGGRCRPRRDSCRTGPRSDAAGSCRGFPADAGCRAGCRSTRSRR